MIIVKGRELLIPENERYLGTNYDTGMENRVFRIARYSQSGTDLSDLKFNVNLIFNSEPLDIAELQKTVDDNYIFLTWTVTAAQVAVTGTVFVCVTGNDTNDTVKWSSFMAPFYTEKSLGEDVETEYRQVIAKVNQEITDREAADATEKAAREAADTALSNEDASLRQSLNAEINLRQTADAALQNSLNAESTARANTDASLQSQIDQIVAPSGEAPSAAEVQNARIGADGVTYDTLGTAIRTQINDINEGLDSVIYPYAKILNADTTLKRLYIPARGKFRIETLNGKSFGVAQTLRVYDSSKTEIDYYSIYKDISYRDLINDTNKDIYYVKLNSKASINDFRVISCITNTLFAQFDKLESNVLNKMDSVLISSDYLRNGSISNGLNTEVVTTKLIFTKAKSIKVVTDRPNKEGFKYVYSYASSSGICFDLNNHDQFRKNYIDYSDPPHYSDEYESWNDGEIYGIQIAIGEYDDVNKNYNPLRVTDFDGYKIYVYDTTAIKNGYPSFYNSYILDRIENIKSKDILIGNSGDSFVFITDMHNENNYYSPFLAKKIYDSTSVKRIIYGGDYVNEPSSKELALSLLTTRRNKCMVKDDVIFMRGNHDTNPYGKGALTVGEFYSIFDKHIEKHINTNKNTYFYNDNESQKIRYIFVDSGVDGSISDVQKNWIKTNTENLNSDWTVIVFMHHGIYTDDKDDRTNIKVYPSLTSVKEVLANVSCKIACIICGHTHIDLSDTSGKYPIICTTCDAHGVQASSMSSDNRDANTINEQAFDVFHIDTANKKVYVTRIGGGENNVIESGNYSLNDREFSYS